MKKKIILCFIFVVGFLCEFLYAKDNYPASHKKIIYSYSAKEKDNYSFKDEKGNLLFKKRLNKCYGFYEGYAVVILENFDYAILDENGNISEKHFEQLGQKFSEGKNFAQLLDMRTGFIDTNGNFLFEIPIKDIDGYLASTAFSDGRAIIKSSDNYWSLIDEKGNILKKLNIGEARDFSCGFSLVIFYDGNLITYNYINDNGDFLLSENCDSANEFNNGYAYLKYGTQKYRIDTNGKMILQ